MKGVNKKSLKTSHQDRPLEGLVYLHVGILSYWLTYLLHGV